MSQEETGTVIRSPEFERPLGEGLDAPGVVLPELPLVSVVMTSYNSAAWLGLAIDSILSQTWVHLELLLVDDASTDQSLALALDRSKSDQRMRVFSMNGNFGTYVAKNAGLRHARGEVFTFMDSDDYSDPQRIEKQLALLRTPGLVATTCNYVRQDDEGNVVLNRGLRERQALISLMIKRQVVDEIGWFDSVRTAADDEFFERVRHTYGRLTHANVAEPLYMALHRIDSLSTSGLGATKLDATAPGAFLSPQRQGYVSSYNAWHSALERDLKRPFMPFPLARRPFSSLLD